jgi:tetratricopeptide (TPR) repeat protein
MTIPPILEEQARQGRVVLLLGAGASVEARDANNRKPPTSLQLSKLISQKFLGGEFNHADLATVAEYAFSEAGVLAVQQYIRDLFSVFEPTPAHCLLTKFGWSGLATTNYDCLVEKAYEKTAGAVQHPIPFIENGDRIIESLRDPKSVKYLKLHGCISRISDENCPLILARDQYLKYRHCRDRIFDQLREWAYEHIIVFIGHSVQDADLRETIFELDQQLKSRPRYFFVAPGRSNIEKRFWETKKVTVLDGTFNEFINALDAALAGQFRGLIVPTTEPHGISRKFRVADASLSKNCSEFLLADAVYVQAATATEIIKPQDFYHGYNATWAPVAQDLDVRRGVSDDILEDVFLLDDYTQRKPLEIVLLKGYAGSGKTVSLRRIAWDAAKQYDCLCIYMNDDARPNIGAIQELIELTRERIFLFIDNAADRISEVRQLIQEIGDYGDLLTVILAGRTNEWNSVPGDLQSAVTTEYELATLKHEEIVQLLELLEKHHALGRLEERSPEERIHAFEALAGRQLLVALHEATLGRPFEEILEDEFRSLVPDEAQRVYLTICLLNRLEVPVRAGIISRIHAIPFADFKERLFRPLEHVVYDSFDTRIRDNVYRARHPIIAEIVFERILRDEAERFQEYYQCLTALNVDYSTDDKAFRQLIRARTLLQLFPNREHVYALFDAATKMVGESEPHLLQQRAIYEMHRLGGDLALAAKLLNRAIELQPYNKSFKHTKAELALKNSDSARTDLERDKLLREATALALETKEQRYGETYSHHTLAKVNMKRLENEIARGNADFSTPTLQNIIRSIETVISEGLQAKPGDSYLLTEHASLAKLLNGVPATIASLEKAVAHNTKLPFLAIQLADCYVRNGQSDKARKVFERAIEANRADRMLNYRYALFLDSHGGKLSDVAYFLRRSFIKGDQNYDAQLRYARGLFLNGDYEEARRQFQELRANRGAPYFSGQHLYEAPGEFHGTVTRIRQSHIFVAEAKSKQTIFIRRSAVKADDWRHLTEGV